MDIGNIQIDSKPARPPNSAHPTIDSNKVLPSPFPEPSAPVITEQPKQVTKPKDDDDCCDARTKWILCNILEIVACIVCCPIMCLSLAAKDRD